MYDIPLVAPVVLDKVRDGNITALFGLAKSPVRLPDVVEAFAGTLRISPAERLLDPLISVVDNTMLRLLPVLDAACVAAVLLTENAVPPAKLPVLLKEMADLPAFRLPDPAAGAGSLDFLQDDVIDNKANAIITGNENNFFIFFEFSLIMLKNISSGNMFTYPLLGILCYHGLALTNSISVW